MSSLEAQTNNLKATFQDFANNVITKDMISSLLNLANAFLELLNTPFGQAATRIVLVTTALTGLQGVLKSYIGFMKGNVIVSGISSLISGFSKMSKVAGPGVTIIEKFTTAFTGFNPVVAGVTAGIAALGLAIYGVKKYVDEVNKPLSDFNEEIDSINDQLQNNQTRLDEINAMPWNARTSEILEEKAALEKQNEELEKNLELLNQEKYERAQTEAENFVFNTGEQKTITKGGSTSRRMSTTFDVTVGGEKAYEEAARQLGEYRQQLEQTGQITDAQRQRFDEMTAAVSEQVEWLQVLVDRGDTLTDSQQRMYDAYYALGNAYDVAVNGAQALANAYTELTNAGYITEETYQQLIVLYPQLADGAVQTANGYEIQQSALENLMSAEQQQQVEVQNTVNAAIVEAQQAELTGQALYDYASAIITASNTQLSVGQQMAALQALAQQAGYTAQAIAQVMGFSDTAATNQIRAAATGLMRQAQQQGKTMTSEEAMEMARANYMKGLWGSLTTNYTPSTTTVNVPKASTPSYSGTGGGSTTSTRSPSTGSATSSVDNSQREAAQAEIKKLQAQQDVIQDQIDAINDKYDQQLQELEDINDELEDQIRLQELLEDLAEAKSRTKMVFKDGRFQYVQDSDAVSKAQQNLDEYYREKELAAKKKQIEAERQLELEGLNAEKKRIEERIKYWRNFLSDMSGVYSSGLNDLSNYVNQWNSYVDSMKKPDTTTGGGGGGGSDDNDNDTPDEGGSGGGSSINDETAAIKQTNARIANQYPRNKGYSSANNSQYDSSTTKKIQAWYGTSADGIWGQNSYAAANNRNIDSAAGLYYAVKSKYGSFAAFKQWGGYAGGTLRASGGLHMVGEGGPELRVLNKGDGVIPAKQTATLWSFANDPAKFLQNIANYGGGRSEVINVQNVTLPNVRNAQDFVAGLRNLAYQRAYAR